MHDVAIVVKGPFAPFSIDVMQLYFNMGLRVVFSHNDECLSNASRRVLDRWQETHHQHFTYILRKPPLHVGFNHRNAQRESIHFGVRHATQTWPVVRYVLVHRADAAFQREGFLDDIQRLYLEQRKVRPQVRVATCPFQLQFTDAYGRYHVDDHCLFGEIGAVLDYWTLDPRLYDAASPYSVVAFPRKQCDFPASESETGTLWVRTLYGHDERRMPSSTLSLANLHILVLHPKTWGYVSRRGKSWARLSLPCAPRHDTMTYAKVAAAAPHSPLAMCRSVDAGYFDCVNATASARPDPFWGCRKGGFSRCFDV